MLDTDSSRITQESIRTWSPSGSPVKPGALLSDLDIAGSEPTAVPGEVSCWNELGAGSIPALDAGLCTPISLPWGCGPAGSHSLFDP